MHPQSAMLNLSDLHKRLSSYGDLQEAITLADLDYFLRLAQHFRREIRLHVPPTSTVTGPPRRLPTYIHCLFKHCLDTDDVTTMQLWSAVKNMVWAASDGSPSTITLSRDEQREVDLYGMQPQQPQEKLAASMFYPPVSKCKSCGAHLCLSTLSRYEVTFYTLRDGARRALSSSFACHSCKLTYYHNYYSDGRLRHYYHTSSVPPIILIEEHVYIESQLCEFFTNLALFAWVSAQNSANIYNHTLSKSSESSTLSEASERPSNPITSEQVSRGFVLNALLRDRAESASSLILPDIGDNDERLKHVMELRNSRIIVHGQAERMHACDVCEKFIPGPNGDLRSLRAATMDGTGLRRPCCKEHNCPHPLVKHSAHFCAVHDHRKTICVVTDCHAVSQSGFRTCSQPNHRQIELRRNERGKAFFQLKQRLQQNQTSQISDALGPTMTTNKTTSYYILTLANPIRATSSPRFGRRKTHDEQLLVACCGTILARGTMFGAEPISGVKDFLKSSYPVQLELPDVIFNDNNCRLQAHLQAQKDDYFRYVMLPVDVFHFKSKHKEPYEFCQKHCNPALWEELADEDGNWVFSSSIAEQVNVWIGGYRSIVRDMLAHDYDFFLDELIKRRNELVVKKLWDTGNCPYRIPSAAATY